jgi:outer membrane protein TolC
MSLTGLKSPHYSHLAAIVGIAMLLACTRTQHRLQADRAVYDVIAERNSDPRWRMDDYSIEIDPRSRYFDPFDPDCQPMPPDDPSSHKYMHQVYGIEGWQHWHDNGTRDELENPHWRQMLGEYVELTEDGSVRLDLDSTLNLAYVHSPSHQSQLETIYLSALDVTTERFRLDTQFFGGATVGFQHDGRLIPENSALTVGRGSGALAFPASATGNAFQLNRRFATAGQMLVGIANSFAWEFTQGDINFASSILSASVIQPLLQGAGKDIALEQLTIVERALLANLRAYQRYRQGFYTQVAIGDLGVAGPQRRGGFFGGTGLTGFTGQGAGGFGGVGGSTFGGGGGGGGGGAASGTGFAGGGAGTVGGYIGLLQQLQQIRNSENSLNLQLRMLSLLEAHLEAGVIDLIQVDQFRQSIETERATLLQNRNGFEFSLENFKTRTLGLPPDLPVVLDDSLIRKFQLISPEATRLEDAIATAQDRIGALDDQTDVGALASLLDQVSELIEPTQLQMEAVERDLQQMDQYAKTRELRMEEPERRLFLLERKQLHEELVELDEQYDTVESRFEELAEQLSDDTVDKTVRGLVVWLSDLYRLVQGSTLIQARAKLETVAVEPVQLDSDDAFAIALANRLDLMNNRAALVDNWRLIAFNADALQTNITVGLSGDLRTSHDNPLSFDGRNSTVRAGIQIDPPFTRLLERNNYRQVLIDYQRSRRGYIQTLDGVHLGLRALLRQIEQLRLNLEIQRRAVAISIRRVDLTREELNRPVPPPRPGGAPAQFGPTAATSLLTALSDLRNTQNNFMSVWLNYYAARMRLARALGIMSLDDQGRWIDDVEWSTSFDSDESSAPSELASHSAPPRVPEHWFRLVQREP